MGNSKARRKPRQKPGGDSLQANVSREEKLRAIRELSRTENPQPQLLLTFLQDRDEVVRYNAVSAIMEVGGAAEAGVLVRHLDDPDREVRYDIVEALHRLGYRPAVEPLVKILREDRDALVRVSAAEALGDLGDSSEGVVRALVSAMEADRSPLVRAYAAESLGRLRAREAFHAIRRRLAREHSTRAHASMLEALTRLGDKDSFRSLVNTLRRTKGWELRFAILNMLTYLIEDLGKECARPADIRRMIGTLDDLVTQEPSFEADRRKILKLLEGT